MATQQRPLPLAGGALQRPTPRRRERGTRDPRQLAAIGLAALFVLVVLGPYMTYRPGTEGEGSPVRQVLYLGSLALVAAGTRAWIDPVRAWPVAWPVTVVLGWCWISLGWSAVPALALRRLVLTTLIVWTLFAGIRAIGYARSLAIFRAVAVAALIGNFVVVALWPEYGVHQRVEDGDASVIGAWCGMMISKNFAGAMCAFTVIAFFFDAGALRPWWRWGVIAATLVFLAGTQSKTSAGILLLALAVGTAARSYNPAYRALLLPLVAVLGVVATLLIAWVWDDVAQILYDPTAFTGRAQIWSVMLAYHRDHFWGTGYGSFWNVGRGVGPIYEYTSGWITTITSGHNGYLDLAAQVGVPGVLLVLLGLFAWPLYRLLTSFMVTPGQRALLIAILVFAAGHNLTESSLLDRDAVGQVVLMTAVALAAVATRQRAGASAGRKRAHG